MTLYPKLEKKTKQKQKTINDGSEEPVQKKKMMKDHDTIFSLHMHSSRHGSWSRYNATVNYDHFSFLFTRQWDKQEIDRQTESEICRQKEGSKANAEERIEQNKPCLFPRSLFIFVWPAALLLSPSLIQVYPNNFFVYFLNPLPHITTTISCVITFEHLIYVSFCKHIQEKCNSRTRTAQLQANYNEDKVASKI